ncbi:MFS transporter [Arthrobacter cupressi]
MPLTHTASSTRTGPLLAIILLSYFMILLDNSVIFTGLPSIQAEMRLGTSGLAWVQDAYTLVFGGLLLLGARAGDLLGRRRVFIAGLAVFAAASLLIGLAPDGGWLVAARALQGVGAAVVAPSSLSLLTASFAEGHRRSRAVAWYGATAGIGASLGLLIGGAAAQWVSWRAGFFINVPIGLAMILLAPRFLPETPRATGRFDVAGAVTATLGMGSLVFGIISAGESGWGSPVTLAALAAGVVLLAVFVRGEALSAQPILPLRLFADRERTGAYAARLLYMGAMIGFFYFTTQFLQGVLGFTPLQAGIAFFPMTVVNFARGHGSPAAGRALRQGRAAACGGCPDAGGHGVAEQTRRRKFLLCRGGAADGAARRWPGPGVRAAHLDGHRGRRRGRRRCRLRPGQHLPPAGQQPGDRDPGDGVGRGCWHGLRRHCLAGQCGAHGRQRHAGALPVVLPGGGAAGKDRPLAGR